LDFDCSTLVGAPVRLANKTLKFFEGHYHDLLNDLGREEVFNDIVGWIDSRLPVSQQTAMAGPTVTA
jgi:acylglycerol lipase